MGVPLVSTALLPTSGDGTQHPSNAKLESLMQLLNAFHPMQESNAAASTERLSDSVHVRLQAQSLRVDEISNSVHEARKTSADNAETLRDIMIVIENLGDNFHQMQEKLLQWDEPK